MGSRALLSPGVLVRTGHTVLTWGITLVLFLHETELKQQEARGELLQPLLFILLVLCSLLLYLAVSLMDPGYVGPDLESPPTQLQKEPKEEQTAMIPPKTLRLRHCGYCLLQQPLRSKHCRSCKRCVRRFDHHCPWIENCVGERNHPLFLAYLAVQLVVLLWGLHLAWSGLHFHEPWQSWFQHNGFIFATFLLLGLFSTVVMLLLASHLYLVASDMTTWEFISPHRIAYLRHRPDSPFDRGLARNLARFFCNYGAVPWEVLYAQEEEGEAV
ncbi:probable palmitoyltransferase ZDHHC12 [Vombatus ursinus]|uniref:probable palmitoyltransferase ZDHHC12 n=1 Tax=Vombatus ursinus TaxID=29139 RepID=UPI000FFD44BF|nr:probable palmitoyltransferase ZDHHC12 [Vombatus ursinus]